MLLYLNLLANTRMYGKLGKINKQMWFERRDMCAVAMHATKDTCMASNQTDEGSDTLPLEHFASAWWNNDRVLESRPLVTWLRRHNTCLGRGRNEGRIHWQRFPWGTVRFRPSTHCVKMRVRSVTTPKLWVSPFIARRYVIVQNVTSFIWGLVVEVTHHARPMMASVIFACRLSVFEEGSVAELKTEDGPGT